MHFAGTIVKRNNINSLIFVINKVNDAFTTNIMQVLNTTMLKLVVKERKNVKFVQENC